MERDDDRRKPGASLEDLPPKCCFVEKAYVVTLKDMETLDDCTETSQHLNQLAAQGHGRIVLDLSQTQRVPGPFLGYLANMIRKQAEQGNNMIIVGSSKAMKVLFRDKNAQNVDGDREDGGDADPTGPDAD